MLIIYFYQGIAILKILVDLKTHISFIQKTEINY